MKIAIVASQFNQMIMAKMLEEAVAGFAEEGLTENDMEIIYVPGSFEIPSAIQKIIDSKKYDGALALGCVVRGETDHYDYICRGVTYGIQKVSIENRFPVAFGILTVHDLDQAVARVKKGKDFAKALVSMINTFKKLS